MNEVGVVVSRYWEDLKWVEEITSPVDVYIYNRVGTVTVAGIRPNIVKTKDDIGNLDLEKMKCGVTNVEIIEMEDDIGYEASTFAHHCHTRYDKLNEFTVFLQGHPSVYCRDIIRQINNPKEFIHTRRIAVDNEYNRGHNATSKAKIEITEDHIECEFLSYDVVWLHPRFDYGWMPYQDNISKAPFWEFCQGIPGWKKDQVESPEPFPFGPGSQTIVWKNRILKHDAEYYKRVQRLCIDYVDPNPITPSWLTRNYGSTLFEPIWKFTF